MLVVLVGSGLAGVFFHYAMLVGVKSGALSKGISTWSRCVAGPSLMLAICAAVIIEYFVGDSPYTLTLALWFLSVIVFTPAYRIIERQVDTEEPEDNKV
ncbi:hypothetical protein ACMDCT_15490 [Halomonadaceae bacterium KBTZ08]